MVKQFRTVEQRTVAYAAHTLLGKMLKADGDLPPGCEMDVSGKQLIITLPPETIVSRSEGSNGDGTENKIATQKTYGFAVIYALLHHAMRYLAKFKLENKAERLMLSLVPRIINAALEDGVTTEKAFEEMHPRLFKGVESIREKLRSKLPTIEYKTQRLVKTDNKPTLKFTKAA